MFMLLIVDQVQSTIFLYHDNYILYIKNIQVLYQNYLKNSLSIFLITYCFYPDSFVNLVLVCKLYSSICTFFILPRTYSSFLYFDPSFVLVTTFLVLYSSVQRPDHLQELFITFFQIIVFSLPFLLFDYDRSKMLWIGSFLQIIIYHSDGLRKAPTTSFFVLSSNQLDTA